MRVSVVVSFTKLVSMLDGNGITDYSGKLLKLKKGVHIKHF